MRAMLVVALLELEELPLEISRGPEQQPIRQPARGAREGGGVPDRGLSELPEVIL
jgi:hypothetical protein